MWKTNLGTTSPPACTDPSEAGVVSTATITTDVPVGTATSVMYVGGGDSKVYALNAATGAVLWSYDVGGNPNTFLWTRRPCSATASTSASPPSETARLFRVKLLQLNRVTGALQNTFRRRPQRVHRRWRVELTDD